MYIKGNASLPEGSFKSTADKAAAIWAGEGKLISQDLIQQQKKLDQTWQQTNQDAGSDLATEDSETRSDWAADDSEAMSDLAADTSEMR